MQIQVIRKENQGYGAFNGGEIVENKPIGFPQDHGPVKPYSNLFYWAHAKAIKDSTIGLHPHQGFEICSFVLKGEIRHYDTKLREWRPLTAGDVQIIRAGNGISHSEWMGAGAEMFQIWFDPNLGVTLAQPASYNDYKGVLFPVSTTDDTKVTTLKGSGSPFEMDTSGIKISRIDVKNSYCVQDISPTEIISMYVISGNAIVNGQPVNESDFVRISQADTIDIQADEADLFIIQSPAIPSYKTYAQLRQ